MFSYFTAPSRAGDQWFSVGLGSSFPDLGQDEEAVEALSQLRPCPGAGNHGPATPGCKAFHVPRTDSSKSKEVPIPRDTPKNKDEAITTTQQEQQQQPESNSDEPGDYPLEDQVLVFRYKGKFHAVDHQCPHSSFPLSRGTPFDIEDFGIVLSAGLSCPKHGWSFDLFTGMSDRGSYKLKIWEVQLRDAKVGIGEQEVWVRRRQRMG